MKKYCNINELYFLLYYTCVCLQFIKSQTQFKHITEVYVVSITILKFMKTPNAHHFSRVVGRFQKVWRFYFVGHGIPSDALVDCVVFRHTSYHVSGSLHADIESPSRKKQC